MSITAAEVFASIRKGPMRMLDEAPALSDDIAITKKVKPNPSNGVHGDGHDQGVWDDTEDDQRVVDDTEDDPGAEFFDLLPTSSSSLVIEIDSDDATEPPYNVHEPNVALRPECYRPHDGFKGKGRAGEPIHRQLPWAQCGKYVACWEAYIRPSSAIPGHYRLRTNDPEHDLKRWISSPNENLNGGSEDRGITQFLDDERFTDDLLRKCLRFAVDECQYEHKRMKHLDDYGRRFPYRSNPKKLSTAPEADPAYVTVPAEEDFSSITEREQLLDTVANAAWELDYLRSMTEEVARRILKKKMTVAKMGNSGEADLLVEKGFMGPEWVEEECWRL